MNAPHGQRTRPAPARKRDRATLVAGDPCPQCNEADLEAMGAKHRCPICAYIAPCCDEVGRC